MKIMHCWVTKAHKKTLEKNFSETQKLIFTDTIDDLYSFKYKNCIIIISLSKVTNQIILNKIKRIKQHPYFLEKKGFTTYNMTKALESSKHHFMIGISDIKSII